MKNKFYSFTLLAFIFIITNNGFAQKLKIEIFNKTEFDLDSVEINDIYIGSIKKDSSLLIVNLEELKIQDGLPFGLPYGIIRDKKRYGGFFGFCGTGLTTVNKGKFKFDIIIREREGAYILYWEKH